MMSSQDSPDKHTVQSRKRSGGQLHFVSSNDSAAQTVILLHGICSSSSEWSLVTPYLLDDYHVLAVDLPLHSRSRHIAPFTMENAADHVAAMIRDHAHGGKAHVVGLSAGGFVAQHLTRKYSELVSTLYVTGAMPFAGFRAWISTHPVLLYAISGVFNKCTPQAVVRRINASMGMQVSDELLLEQQENFSYALLRDGFGGIAASTFDKVKELAETEVRTLAVAGEKQDDVENTRKMGQVLKEHGSPQNMAAVAKDAIHAWDLQKPELMAESIKAWIVNKPLPEGIGELC